MKRIAIIGGGASGLMAACLAKREDNEVVIFEKEKIIGRKILATGNGRCNISNKKISLKNYNLPDENFLKIIFNQFNLDKTIGFFKDLGILFSEGKEGKLYPSSWQAETIPKLFTYRLKRKKIKVKLETSIEKVELINKKFKLKAKNFKEDFFDSLILSTGSLAHPQLGGSNGGYSLASSLGHRITDLRPALLPINIPLKVIHRLQGLRWSCSLKVKVNKNVVERKEGELLFTAYGLSGPVTLDISRAVNQLLAEKKSPEIIVDFFPQESEEDLLKKFSVLWKDKEKKVSFSLFGILPERIVQVLFFMLGIDLNLKIKDLSSEGKYRIVKIFKNLSLKPGKERGFREAVVVAGGVDLKEVNPYRMESKKNPNLHFTGEILDVDGQSGGYNLQFAWSTGAIAGLAQHSKTSS